MIGNISKSKAEKGDALTFDMLTEAEKASLSPKPDWNQTDETKADFIKNKPDLTNDSALDGNSENPVQNKVITNTLNSQKYYGDMNIVPTDSSLFEFDGFNENDLSVEIYGFSETNDIEELVIPYEYKKDEITYRVSLIAPNAFENNTFLKTVVFPSNLDTVTDYAFGGCTNLEKAVFSKGNKGIWNAAFSNCTKLKTITLPNTITEIYEKAFDGSALTDIYYEGTKEQWESINIADDNGTLLNANIHFNWVATDTYATKEALTNGSLAVAEAYVAQKAYNDINGDLIEISKLATKEELNTKLGQGFANYVEQTFATKEELKSVSGGNIAVDSVLDEKSENPVQNKVVAKAIADHSKDANVHIINLDVLETISLNDLTKPGVYTFIALTVDEWTDDEYTGVMKNDTMSCYYRVTVSVLTQNQYTTYITQKIEQFSGSYDSNGHYWKNCIILRTFNIHHEEQDDGSYINTIENVKEIPLLIENEPYNLVTKTDYATSDTAGVVKAYAGEHSSYGVKINSSGKLQLDCAYGGEIRDKASQNSPITPAFADVVVNAATHKEMSDNYDVSTLVLCTAENGKQGQYPASYEATKGYVDNKIGNIETSLENIITKYGLGGDSV